MRPNYFISWDHKQRGRGGGVKPETHLDPPLGWQRLSTDDCSKNDFQKKKTADDEKSYKITPKMQRVKRADVWIFFSQPRRWHEKKRQPWMLGNFAGTFVFCWRFPKLTFSKHYIHWVETYTGYCSKMSRCLHWIREKPHDEGKEIRNFSYLILFSVLGVCQFRIAICIFRKLYAWFGIKHWTW